MGRTRQEGEDDGDKTARTQALNGCLFPPFSPNLIPCCTHINSFGNDYSIHPSVYFCSTSSELDRMTIIVLSTLQTVFH